MDGGGFNGHPSDENYARWIEFAAFVPIFRVHGTLGEKRQPWVYGPVAEKAATHAIRLRYRLLPYIYSFAHHGTEAGVGLVRPLSFGWPGDRQVRNDVDAWMFGRWLLVSPVVREGATRKRIYLPAGTWTDWTTGKVYRGRQTITVPVDHQYWADIPLFIRAGAIIPTQPVLDYVGQRPIKTVTVDLFPADHQTHFDYYDDDGDTYAYAHGAFFRQRLSVVRDDNAVRFTAQAPKGSYKPALKFYLLKVHGMDAANVRVDGHALAQAASVDALEHSEGKGWARDRDRYGAVTLVRIAAGAARKVTLRSAR
jgi:alpha-glucosidase (family GH31 glycosyl hydrolase)